MMKGHKKSELPEKNLPCVFKAIFLAQKMGT